MLHDFKHIFPVVATYIISCYAAPSRLLIIGWGEILSSQGATLGDLPTMKAYALGILPSIKLALEFINLSEMNAVEVAFAYEFSVTGSLNSSNDYWDKLTAIRRK